MDNKIKINILGSCVSRVSMLDGNQNGHGIPDDEIELQYFLDKQNLVLAMMPPAFSREDVDLVTQDQLWDKSRIHVVHQSLNKDTLNLLLGSEAEFLVIDLMDFQTNFAVLGNTAFDTNAYEFMNTVLFHKVKDNLRLYNFMELPTWIYYPYVDLFFEKIMTKYDSDHIILNRFRANTYYLGKDGQIKAIPDSYKNPYQANDQYNKQLRLLEDYIIAKYQPYVIDISKYYMGDENEWDNLQGAHFEKEFYHETFHIIKNIIKNRPEEKIWDNQNLFENDREFNSLLELDSSIAVMEQLVEAEDLLWINILAKLHKRYPEDVRVKEYMEIVLGS